MIIVELLGGFGNQMFQYALGRCLSIRKNTELELDINSLLNSLGGCAYRRYALNVFNINAEIVNGAKLKHIKRLKKSKLYRKLYRFCPYSKKILIREQESFKYDPNIFKCSKNVYLEGYWQSEKYFIDIEDVIRKEFTICLPQGQENLLLSHEIDNNNSVCVHVRRGDYVTDKNTNVYHGVCSMEYYHKAIELLLDNGIVNPYFFVFSDDPNWVRENLKLKYPIKIVDINLDKPYEDLRLMSRCKHFVIANSSFSWWGAWLSPNSDKIVIAPKQWITDETRDVDDLFPKGWIRI
jgi:hypothetical protein